MQGPDIPPSHATVVLSGGSYASDVLLSTEAKKTSTRFELMLKYSYCFCNRKQ